MRYQLRYIRIATNLALFCTVLCVACSQNNSVNSKMKQIRW